MNNNGETGPIYGVPLIDTLQIGGMLQQMASRADLVHARSHGCERLVAAYEIAISLLAARDMDINLQKGINAALEALCHPKL